MSVANENDVHILYLQWWWLLIAWGAWGAGALAWEAVKKLRESRDRERRANSGHFVNPEWYGPAFGVAGTAGSAIKRQDDYEAAHTSPRSQSAGRDEFKWWLEVVGTMVGIITTIVQLFIN